MGFLKTALMWRASFVFQVTQSPVQAQMKNVKDVGIAVVLTKCINHLLMGTVRILHYVVNLGMG